MRFSDSATEKPQELAEDHPEQVEQHVDHGRARADEAAGRH